MRIAFLFATFALFATPVYAAPNISKGNWEVGGAFALNHTSKRVPSSPTTRSTSFVAQGQAQYFFADQWSAGLEVGYMRLGNAYDHYEVGPVVTKYLWVEDKLAPYLSMFPIDWSHSAASGTTYRSGARLGAKYFLTDSVSFGPAVDYSHEWGTDTVPESNTFSFLGLFSIHL